MMKRAIVLVLSVVGLTACAEQSNEVGKLSSDNGIVWRSTYRFQSKRDETFYKKAYPRCMSQLTEKFFNHYLVEQGRFSSSLDFKVVSWDGDRFEARDESTGAEFTGRARMMVTSGLEIQYLFDAALGEYLPVGVRCRFWYDHNAFGAVPQLYLEDRNGLNIFWANENMVQGLPVEYRVHVYNTLDYTTDRNEPGNRSNY